MVPGCLSSQDIVMGADATGDLHLNWLVIRLEEIREKLPLAKTDRETDHVQERPAKHSHHIHVIVSANQLVQFVLDLCGNVSICHKAVSCNCLYILLMSLLMHSFHK